MNQPARSHPSPSSSLMASPRTKSRFHPVLAPCPLLHSLSCSFQPLRAQSCVAVGGSSGDQVLQEHFVSLTWGLPPELDPRRGQGPQGAYTSASLCMPGAHSRLSGNAPSGRKHADMNFSAGRTLGDTESGRCIGAPLEEPHLAGRAAPGEHLQPHQ